MESTAQNAPTTTAIGVRYGLLTGLVSIVFTFIVMMTGQMGNSAIGYLSLIIPIVAIVLAQREFRARNGGFMSYGEGLGIGMLLAGMSGLLSSVFSFVYRGFIDPSVNQQVVDQMRAQFEKAGSLNDAQIDQAISMSQKFSTGPIGLVVGVVVSVIGGLILSLIISAVMKRTRPEFE